MVFDGSYFINSFSMLLPYLPVTLRVLGISVLLSLIFGLGLTWCKLRKNPIVRNIAEFYTQVIRGTPFIVLLFLIYFGLPKLFSSAFGLNISGMTKEIYMIITLVMFGSSRMSEAMRSAYLAIPKGQMEAAHCCSMSTWQGFWHVIFPQALRLALPNLCNLIVGNLLETAVGFSIGVVDFFGNARQIISNNFGLKKLEIYLAVAITYWLLAVAFTKILELLEDYLRKHQGLPKRAK